jgi:hypothetical protein
MLTIAEINRLAKAVAPAITEAVKQQQDEILTVKTAAALLGTTVYGIHKRCQRGAIPYNKVSGRLYFSKNALLKYYLG